MQRSCLSFMVVLLVGCGGDEDAKDPSGTGDTGPVEPTFPADPSPFTVHVEGQGFSEDLVFDSPTCSSPAGSQNLRVFWRNQAEDHVFVLLSEILGDYTGAGTYDGARSRLQEEAGGQGRYFEAQGVQATVEGVTETQVWGSWSVSGMSDVTLDPLIFPIWCPSLN